MANIKLTELDPITALDDSDVLVAVDVSADETHKITAANLFRTLPDGTAAAPALAFSSDQANGVYLAGTDTVGISTGGTQRVTVDGSGNVTISGDLTVSGATTTVESTTVTIDDKNIELGSVASPSNTTADGGGITLKGATDKTLKWINSTGCWTFNQPMNFNDHVRIDSSGNVGIGVTSPVSLLHVRGASGASPYFYLDAGSTAAIFGINDGATKQVYLGSVTNAPVLFRQNNTERMRIDTSGRLGIGTSSPSNLLHVNGQARFEDFLRGHSTQNKLYIADDIALSATKKLYLDGGSNTYIHETSADNIAVITSGSERLRIDGSGNVGIGTASPNNKLHVSGSGAFSGTASSLSNDQVQIGFAAPEGFIKAKNSSGSPAANLGLYTTNASGTTSKIVHVSHDGKVGIGTTSPGSESFVVETSGSTPTIRINAASSYEAQLKLQADGTATDTQLVAAKTDGSLAFARWTGAAYSERMRIDSSGRLLVGTSSNFGDGSTGDALQVATTAGGHLLLGRNDSSVSANNTIGLIRGYSYGGSAWQETARISIQADGDHASGDKPGRLVFSTTADNASSPTERMRIGSSGNVGIANSSPTTGRLVVGSTSDSSTNVNITSSTSGTGLLSFSDTNSGQGGIRYFHSTDHMGFYAADNERMRIDSSGNVIVGTSSTVNPTLRILGSSAHNSFIQFADGDSNNVGQLQYSHSSNALITAVNGSERMRIDSSGRVGIGETNIQSTLHVAKNIADSTAITWTNSQLSIATAIGGNSTANRSTLYFAPYGSDNNYAPSAISASAGTSGASTLKFFTNASGNLTGQVQAYERMRIDSSGRLLLGTTTEGQGAADDLTIATTGHTGMTIRSGTSHEGAIYFSDGTSGDNEYRGFFVYDHDDDHLRIGTSAVERLRINSNGAWGIEGASNYGTSGQVLTSNGNDSPTWQDASGGGATDSISEGNTSVECVDTGSDGHITFDTEGSERIRVDNAGNVGINETSPATTGFGATLRVKGISGVGGLFAEGSSGNSWFGFYSGNSVADTPALIYPSTTGSNIRFGTTSGVYTNGFAEKARLDSSGRLLIGTTTEGHTAADDLTIATTGNTGITLRSGTSNNGNLYFSDATSGTAEHAGFVQYNHANNQLRFGTGGTERLRITSAGDVNVKDFSPRIGAALTAVSGNFSSYFGASGTSNSNLPMIVERYNDNGVSIEFKRSSSVVGNINVTASSTNYATSSDHRLKENVVDLDGAITRVKQLAPKRFNFIVDADTTVDGFLAHEAATVVPEAVTGTHNEVDDENNPVYQGIDQSKLVPLLTAALQEAIAKIETLETKVAALEAS